MDLYLTALALGGAGLATMALSGLAHHGHDGSGSHGGGHAQAHGHGHAGGSHAAADHSDHAHAHPGKDHGSHSLLALLSPRTLFSLCLGFGTAGLILRAFLQGPWLVFGAVAGALVFERLLVGPVWRFVMRFESSPAQTLESAITSEAIATSSFDRDGNGMVRVEVDGQVVQLLGTLSPTDRALGVSVRSGARLRIEEVDVSRHRCVVSLVRA